MKNKLYFNLNCWLVILFLILVSCSKPEAKPVTLTIFAGQSLKSALLEVKKDYIKQKDNLTINYLFGNVESLQSAVEQGKSGDIYMVGSSKSQDYLQSKGFSIADTRKPIIKNRIVLITPKDTTGISNFKDLLEPRIETVAIGSSEVSASGKYSHEVIASFGILERIKPKFILKRNSAEVVSSVENRETNVGISYATEAISSSKVRIGAIAPENYHTPIVYSAVVLKTSQNIPEAKEFVQFLQSDQAGAIFVKYGFAIAVDRQTSQ